MRFLFAVDERALTGQGCAITVTVRDCPPSSAVWHELRRRFEWRLRRMGLIRGHWLTEWQRRGVPHMHQALWFPEPEDPARFYGRIFTHWLELAEPYGAQLAGQHFAFIHDAVGWFQYVSKHAARGLHHYQRSPEAIPEGWQFQTGRMWGHLGEWSLRDAMRFDLDGPAFWRFRRMVRSHAKANARATGSGRRIRATRRMLRCTDRPLSTVRGVREWLGESHVLAIFAMLAAQGHRIEQ
jgi:hypothetical protein